MIKFLGVTSTSAVSEPRTTATAATNFPRFRDDAAFGANGTDARRRGCWCMWIVQNTKDENMKTVTVVCERIYLQGVTLGLTFAGLRALRPAVINVFVANTSTIFIPSTARSATTDSAGFLERAALWARHRIRDR